MEHIQNRLVFIVEDNEMYSMMLEYKLSNDSIIKCMCFKTGEECLQNLELDPMLIILDYWLPGINGKETFDRIKKQAPDIPVVMLTRNKDKDVEKMLLKSGVHDYINKEEDSIKQVKHIINTVVDEIIRKEESRVKKMKLFVFLLFVAAVFITIMYMS
jgi:DNA-binding response OmpR family regulator